MVTHAHKTRKPLRIDTITHLLLLNFDDVFTPTQPPEQWWRDVVQATVN
jgi:hypothetical protein